MGHRGKASRHMRVNAGGTVNHDREKPQVRAMLIYVGHLVCKTVGNAYSGSNPLPATTTPTSAFPQVTTAVTDRPDSRFRVAVVPLVVRWVPLVVAACVKCVSAAETRTGTLVGGRR